MRVDRDVPTEVHADGVHGYRVTVPTRTPSGGPVIVEESMDGAIHRLHGRSADGSEVYLEVVSYAGLIDHGPAIKAQRDGLLERAPDGLLGPVQRATIGGRPATAFDFEGELGGLRRARRFAWVDAGARTYRIVFDPTSVLNERILDTLRFEADA